MSELRLEGVVQHAPYERRYRVTIGGAINHIDYSVDDRPSVGAQEIIYDLARKLAAAEARLERAREIAGSLYLVDEWQAGDETVREWFCSICGVVDGHDKGCLLEDLEQALRAEEAGDE